jgi:hypothetical protein
MRPMRPISPALAWLRMPRGEPTLNLLCFPLKRRGSLNAVMLLAPRTFIGQCFLCGGLSLHSESARGRASCPGLLANNITFRNNKPGTQKLYI